MAAGSTRRRHGPGRRRDQGYPQFCPPQSGRSVESLDHRRPRPKIVEIPPPEEAPLPAPVPRPDLDPRTVDKVEIGREKSEKEHGLQGQHTGSGVFRDRVWRHAGGGGWFSYQLTVKPEVQQTVHVCYWGSEEGTRRFDILADGQKIGNQVLLHNQPDKFFDVEYPLPQDLMRGKTKITVRFQAEPGATAGGIFGLRILEAKP